MIHIKQDIITSNGMPVEGVQYGKHCFIYRGKEVEQIKKELGRENQGLCLKVFWAQDKEGNWGDDPKDQTDKRNTTIKEATQIQNICWYHGLAPRVYKVMKVKWSGSCGRGEGKQIKERICDAQVTDDLGDKFDTDEEAHKVYAKVEKLGEEYGWKANYRESKAVDSIGGKFLDFQTFNLRKDYKEKIKDKYIENGTYGKKYYHNVPELDLNGAPRDNESRAKWLGLDKIDFKGKSYCDLGCANGWFTRYASARGARRVHGFDTKQDAMKDPLLSAWLVANLQEKYNVDYMEKDLGSDSGIDYGQPLEDILTGVAGYKYDIVTFLSMTYHIGVPFWLPDLIGPYMGGQAGRKGLLIVEDNSKNRDADKKLKQLFRKVELKGHCEDRNGSHLPIYWCYK